MNVDNELQVELARFLRSRRRWRLAWALVFVIAVSLVAVSTACRDGCVGAAKEPGVPLVRIEGIIASGRSASIEMLEGALTSAFANPTHDGVIVIANTPGGSPVQSQLIYEALMRLKSEYKKKLVVVAEGALASGGYLFAMAADRIYAMPSSTVGSIGVIMSATAYDKAASELGLERRVYTAGGNKSRFDPMLPESAADKAKAQELLADIHAQFIATVESGRGDRLKGDKSLLFSGDYWTGRKAVELGLVDELGSVYVALDKEFGASRYEEYEAEKPFGGLLGLISAKLMMFLSTQPPQVQAIQH